LHSKRVK